MNYADAKKIIADKAPNLILDDEVPGQHHICVRKDKNGEPFSIILITTEVDPGDAEAAKAAAEADEKHLTDSLDQAVKMLGANEPKAEAK